MRKKGLLVFENVHDGTNKRHELSEHAGMPVIEGENGHLIYGLEKKERQKLYDYKRLTKGTPPST